MGSGGGHRRELHSGQSATPRNLRLPGEPTASLQRQRMQSSEGPGQAGREAEVQAPAHDHPLKLGHVERTSSPPGGRSPSSSRRLASCIFLKKRRTQSRKCGARDGVSGGGPSLCPWPPVGASCLRGSGGQGAPSDSTGRLPLPADPGANVMAGTEPSLRPAHLPRSHSEGGSIAVLSGRVKSPQEKKQGHEGRDSPWSTTSQTSTFTMSSVAEMGKQ